ncbi:TlpA disulfide reductase family protein [Dyadobacter alkalitolerans]|uniref:TlpA disulfide reductase family protein n=1 Tax=Dyadobacter alkalitolerans TaxID=492736 RepID=UPI0004204A3A|nr:TlpA disulfide reductase family protein [Dyadobacter alkalitolerans]
MRIRTFKIRHLVFTLLLLVLCTAPKVFSQIPKQKGPASAAEIQRALNVVESNLDSIKAHRTFIYAMGLSNPLLLEKYNMWLQRYPTNVNIPLAVGTVFHNAEMPQAKEYLLKAAEIDGNNGKIWAMLAADAGMRGEGDIEIKYIKKAADVDSSNVDYAYGYLTSFENGDPNIYRDKVFDFVRRFSSDDRGAVALYWLAERATNLDERIQYFEELRKLYHPSKYPRTASRLRGLVDAYLQIDPQRALTLINEIYNDEDTNWKVRRQVAQSFIEIKQLEHAEKYSDAKIILDSVKLPKFNYLNDYTELKKAFIRDKVGDVKGAYDSLCVKFAKLPTDAIYQAIEMYGKKLGKNHTQVKNDIEAMRNSTATIAFPFELGLYTSDKKLSLNSLKGKVVLLTFWFPGCGPCKAEFPHFQEVVDSFKGDSLVYIGINVFPSQDGYVLPFVKNNKYSFIPLRGTVAFAADHYGAPTQPANFLIDRDGNVVYKDFQIDNTNRRTLELMITSLLKGNISLRDN